MKNPNFGIGARNVAALARARQPQQAVQQRPVATQSGGGIGSLLRRANATMAGSPRSFTDADMASLRARFSAPKLARPVMGHHGMPPSGFQSPPGMRLTAPTGPASGPPVSAAQAAGMKKGGKVKAKPVKKMAKGGSTASKRGDGCATKGKTKGRFV